MLKRIAFAGLFAASFFAALSGTPAQAQATRTWVSGVGSDANPCSRTAPCKTFAGAISNTAAGGEIDALDPGGYGALTITKSITIDGGAGQVGSVLTNTGSGIVVNGSGIAVTLHNISINGLGAASIGISVINAAQVNVIHCDIFGFTTYGIGFLPTNAGARLYVDDTTIRNGVAYGIVFSPASAGTPALGTLENVRIFSNGIAMRVTDNGRVTATRSQFSSNTSDGIAVNSTATAAYVRLEETSITNNGGNGLTLSGAAPAVYMSNTFIVGNALKSIAIANGSAISFGNNRIANNGINIGPNGSAPQQ